MREPLCLTVLVLTEDSSDKAHTTWETLLKKTFGLLVTGTRTHRIQFEPSNDRQKAATRGNLWQSTRLEDQPKIVDLRRSIATKLLEDGPPGFVLFHIDGDRPWTDSDSAENPRRFDDLIRDPVSELVRDHLTRQDRAAEIDERLRHLIVVVPYYELEAWLYQNLDEVRKRCCGDPEHLARIERWAANRAALDEEHRPKKEALPCMADKHNEALAKGFDADSVLKANASYAAAVTHLLQSAPELLTALEATTRLA